MNRFDSLVGSRLSFPTRGTSVGSRHMRVWKRPTEGATHGGRGVPKLTLLTFSEVDTVDLTFGQGRALRVRRG
jgi:hypothetical protein